MPKRRIDPATGEPGLTYREQMLVDEYINNGGNGSRAAVSAGYGSARPDQSAHQVLRRPEVQRRIQARIAESRVSADEIIGTLASFMRGTLADFLDESGEFNIEVAKQRGVDHTLRSITATTREIQATKSKPAQVIRTYRGQLHSQIQAARALAHILGIDRKGGLRSLTPGPRPLTTAQAPDHRPLTTDFDPLVWLDDLISDQMRQTGQPRSAVIETLLQVRPEIAKYLRDLEQSRAPKPFEDLSLRDTATDLGKTLDLLIALAESPEPHDPPTQDSRLETPDSDNSHPLPMFSPVAAPQQEVESQTPLPPEQGDPRPTQDSRLTTTDSQDSQPLSMFCPAPGLIQQEVPIQKQDELKRTGPLPRPDPTPNLQPSTFNLQPGSISTQDSRLRTQDSPFGSCQNFQLIYRRLSEATGEALDRLQFSDLVQEWMDRFELTEAAAIDAIRQRAGLEPSLFGFIVGVCIKEYQRMRAIGLIREPVTAFPTQDSRLTTPDSQESQPLPMFCSASLTTETPSVCRELSRHFP